LRQIWIENNPNAGLEGIGGMAIVAFRFWWFVGL